MKRSFALMLTLIVFASCLGKEPQAASSLALTAPAGKLLHGVFIGGGEEEDPTPTRLERYENAVGKRAAWVYYPTIGSRLGPFHKPRAKRFANRAACRLFG